MKLRANPESSVGLMTMKAGKLDVLATLTTDDRKILKQLNAATAGGEIDLVNALKVAKLALKFRQSKNHRQRIVVFVGSPVETEEKELVKLGKKFAKDGIAVDVVNFGEDEVNTAKLEAFIAAVNKNDGSHLVTVPAGMDFSDALRSSSILASADGSSGGGGGGGGGFLGDVDPSMDPELAMVLRVSMEEERAKQAKLAAEGGSEGAAAATPDAGAGAIAMDEDPELAAALAMSMAEMNQESGPSSDTPAAAAAEPAAAVETAAEEEDPELAAALAMSMADSGGAEGMDTAAEETIDSGAVLNNADFLADVMSGLDGVDVNDPAIQAALAGVDKGEEEEEKKD
jgi:26S proteasome regulatory subunit N10